MQVLVVQLQQLDVITTRLLTPITSDQSSIYVRQLSHLQYWLIAKWSNNLHFCLYLPRNFISALWFSLLFRMNQVQYFVLNFSSDLSNSLLTTSRETTYRSWTRRSFCVFLFFLTFVHFDSLMI